MKHAAALLTALLFLPITTLHAADKAGLDQLVAETHSASLKLRQQALRKTIAKDSVWPSGIWGDNLWTLAALYLNEQVDAANARLLKSATALRLYHPKVVFAPIMSGAERAAERKETSRSRLNLIRP